MLVGARGLQTQKTRKWLYLADSEDSLVISSQKTLDKENVLRTPMNEVRNWFRVMIPLWEIVVHRDHWELEQGRLQELCFHSASMDFPRFSALQSFNPDGEASCGDCEYDGVLLGEIEVAIPCPGRVHLSEAELDTAKHLAFPSSYVLGISRVQ